MKTLCLILLYLFLLIANGFSQGGLLDSTFGINGVASCLPEGYGYSVAIQTDGKIVTGGSNNGNFILIRFNISGTVDSSFGIDGIAKTLMGDGSAGGVSIAIQTDGKILKYNLK